MNGERMDLRYAVGVLMSHGDLLRRLAAEAAAGIGGEAEAEAEAGIGAGQTT
ncbi:hypothetical protein [Geodermatophilus sp. SYSU D01176]